MRRPKYKSSRVGRFDGTLIVNGGYDVESGHSAIARGDAELVVFGVPFLANPDLPIRYAKAAPLNVPDQATFYAGEERGATSTIRRCRRSDRGSRAAVSLENTSERPAVLVNPVPDNTRLIRTTIWDRRSSCEGYSKHDCCSRRRIRNSTADHSPMSAAGSPRRPREDVCERAARTSLHVDPELVLRRLGGKEAHLANRRVPERRSFAEGEAVACLEETYTRPNRDLGT
jgi:hypothetical protein